MSPKPSSASASSNPPSSKRGGRSILTSRRGSFNVAFLITAILIACARDASAQLCAGLAPYNYLPFQLAVAVAGGTGGGAVLPSAGYGKDVLFGMIAAARGGNQQTVDARIGSDGPVTPDNRIRACPIASVGMARADDRTHLRLGAGGHASLVMINSPRIWVVPTIGLRLQKSGPATFVAMEAGIGLVRRPFAIRPSVIQQFGDLRGTRAEVSFSIGFGE